MKSAWNLHAFAISKVNGFAFKHSTIEWALYTDSTQHVFCYIPFLFFKYVLFVNKGQDLH